MNPDSIRPAMERTLADLKTERDEMRVKLAKLDATIRKVERVLAALDDDDGA